MPAGFRKVYQYDLDGNFVAEYENISAASFFMKEKAQSLYFCLNGKYNFSRGFFWSFNYHIKLSNEILNKIRKSKSYKTLILNNCKIYQYDLDGNFVAEYDNINVVSNDVIVRMNIKRILEGRYKTSDSYIWKTQFFKKLPKEILNLHHRTNKIEVYVYDINGNFIKKFNNLKDVSDEFKINRGTVSNLLNGIRQKQYKNYIFRREYYKKLPKEILNQHIDIRFKEIIQFDLNGKFIKEWSSLKEIRKKYNNSNIASVLTGNRNNASGFIWKYKDNV